MVSWENKDNQLRCCSSQMGSWCCRFLTLVQMSRSEMAQTISTHTGALGFWAAAPLTLLPLYPHWPETRIPYTHTPHTHPDARILPFVLSSVRPHCTNWKSKTRLDALRDHSGDPRIAHKRHFVRYFFSTARDKPSFCGFWQTHRPRPVSLSPISLLSFP